MRKLSAYVLLKMRSLIAIGNGVCSKSPVKTEKDKDEEAEEKLRKKICQITDAAPGSLSSVSPQRPPPR
ncbi:hypothetical protein RHGRI_031273 [Rhododendron griersonianum]|uniref:Uncharacterized protein n=1 Tax=Rhododendron griersonianum TaxID=479676 RepID=A0AAV6IAS3_9ERIC|nr:hypothetical protein RHGRI_031273 [Rhododendron griersonianum]